MKYEQWNLRRGGSDEARRQLELAGVPPLCAVVLCARGLDTPEKAREFLANGPELLHDPFLMRDMDRAAVCISQAVERGDTIAVYGDYDVDGITSTCLLTEFLRERGGHVICYIPDRTGEGYGLNRGAVDRLGQQGVKLIVTVDCGITAAPEVAYAKALGIDVVVTDHHHCKDNLPDAAAVVDPRRPDCTYPFKELAGVGVALKVALALTPRQDWAGVLEQYGELAAIGTVADVMRLTDENRAIVTLGLERLAHTCRPGLKALIQEVSPGQPAPTAVSIGYGLAPRINAAGRMERAEVAVELLLTRDPQRGLALAQELCQLNRERQAIECSIFEACAAHLARRSELAGPSIVLAGEGWHQGVIGIVCSRLCDRYGCPVVLISVDEDGVGKGSGRSIGSFNLFEALTSCEDLFERYGGHALAAGLTVQADRIEELRTRLRKYAETHVTMAELVPQLHIDCMVQSEWLTQENIESLSVLEPYGMKNAEPVFCMKNMTVEEITPLSSDRHVRLSLIKDGKRFSAIWFGIGAGGLGFVEGNTVDAAFHLEINEFRGRRSVQLTICDVQLSDCEHLADQKILNLYNTLMQDGPLTAREARLLLPDRKDLVAVWRHVTCRAEDGRLSVPDGALSRRVAWESRRDINIGKLFVCLDVFQESGLISYHFKEGMLNILLKPYEGKADISGSVVLATLQSMAG